jgi:hypothetical protein
MQESDNGFPNYYDGSLAAISDEQTESAQQDDAADKEEWRSFVGFNPFGA